MKLYEEFKLYENMWESTEIDDSSNVYEDLRVKLIDEFNVKGFTQEVAILENCTLSASPYHDLVIALKDTKDVLYIHPELTKPENFEKACVAVRVELAYPILGIKITDPKNIAEVKQAFDAIKARLTSKEVDIAKNFILANTHYTGLEVGTSQCTEQVVYVLSTFDGDEYVYDNFYKAVDDAENKYCTEANSIYPYYLNEDGTYTEMVPDGVEGCLCWTDEEGIIEESCQQKTKNALNENKDTIYSFDLDAYNSSKDKMYTDKNNLSSYDVEGGYPYQFKGTYNEVVKKLNSIVKNGYDILMLFVENDATGEEVLGVDDRFLLYNKLVPANTPFLANVLTKHITEAPQRDWKARAKSVVDNDLFVDFD